jgi:hypothetical protein
MTDKAIWDGNDVPEGISEEILKASTDDILNRVRLMENEIKVPFPVLLTLVSF